MPQTCKKHRTAQLLDSLRPHGKCAPSEAHLLAFVPWQVVDPEQTTKLQQQKMLEEYARTGKQPGSQAASATTNAAVNPKPPENGMMEHFRREEEKREVERKKAAALVASQKKEAARRAKAKTAAAKTDVAAAALANALGAAEAIAKVRLKFQKSGPLNPSYGPSDSNIYAVGAI
eukprot:SAG11_NODE_2162_length_3729_cov_1.561433_3_plen_175_part_00